ncbi:hypothetical protein HQ571_00365 [Candidatus Kuenenbacteria bacterium]|nr:hypothetical protein [Candidatus Kuenenbacteria bacterium]
MEIFGVQLNLDWSWIDNLGSQPLYAIAWHFFVNGGWILFVVAGLWGAWKNFVYWRQGVYVGKQTFVFLAIDIPKNNLQTPRAVENIFSALAGAHQPLDWHEKTFKGEFQLGFSLEIVSIDGFIQFIIQTPVQFRNLVEAAVYSQYPEAEITETTDYLADINIKFPNDEYNLWGADLVFTREDYYPLKTYKEFQEELDKEFKDPMAALLEVMSKIGPGEQIWIQLLAYPADIGWEKKGLKAVNKMLGIDENGKRNMLDKIGDAPLSALNLVGEQLLGMPAGEDDKKDKEKMNMMFLPPKEKREVDAILEKVDKISFKCKYRYIYYGKKEVFKKGLGVSGVMGAMKQFGATGLNSLKPGKNKTQTKLWMKKPRMNIKQNRIFAVFKKRYPETCDGTQLMNVEELATLYHFPYIEVKTPLVKQIESTRARAPIGLPMEDKKSIPDEIEELPPMDEQEKIIPVVDYDNDYFEQRFAVDKSGEADRERKAKIMKELNIQKKVDKAVVKEELENEAPISVDEPSDDVGSDIPNNLPFE